MARRQKAELLGLVERIVTLYNQNGKSLKEIEEELRAEGIDISRESIRLTVKSNKQIAKELQKTREETTALINVIRDNPATDANEATIDYLISKAFDYTKRIESLDFKDLPELSRFIKDMTGTKAKIVKLRMDYRAMYNQMKEDLIAQLRGALEGDPELFSRLFTLVSNMEAPSV